MGAALTFYYCVISVSLFGMFLCLHKISRSNSSDILHEFLYDDQANKGKEIMQSESERESNFLSSSPSSVLQSEMHTEKESNPAVKPTEVSRSPIKEK